MGTIAAIKYLNNTTFSGGLIQGYDVNAGRDINELATDDEWVGALTR